jgi:hypothetical protein
MESQYFFVLVGGNKGDEVFVILFCKTFLTIFGLNRSYGMLIITYRQFLKIQFELILRSLLKGKTII